jgi:hypothetical protein
MMQDEAEVDDIPEWADALHFEAIRIKEKAALGSISRYSPVHVAV